MKKALFKSFFYVAFIALNMLGGGCFLCDPGETLPESISITPCHSPQGAKGTLSLGICCNLYDDVCYENVCKPLQQAEMRCVFYCKLERLEAYVGSKNPVVKEKVRRYTEAGHLIGIDIDNQLLTENSPEELLKKIDQVAEGIYHITGSPVSVLRVPPVGGHPFEMDQKLAEKYILDDESDWRHTFSGWGNCSVDYRDPADEAVQAERWAKFYFRGNVGNFDQTLDLIADVKKHQIAVVPYPEMKSYRMALHSVFFTAKKENSTLTVASACPEFPEIPICYRIRQHCGASSETEHIVSLKNRDICQIPLKGRFEEIEAIPPLQLTVLPNNAEASITLTVDDTNKMQAKDWYPAIRKHDLVSTHFLVMNSALIQKMLPDWKAMEDDGLEIGCHSFAHSVRGEDAQCLKESKSVGSLPEKLFEEDLQKALAVIKECDFHCTAYCFPGNHHSYSTRKCVQKHFRFMVRNERCTARPEIGLHHAAYLELMKRRHDNPVLMFHSPEYRDEKVLEAFEPLFADVAAQKHAIMNWTFSQRQAYFLARAESDIIIHSCGKKRLRFSVSKSEEIPCLLPMTCQLRKDPESIRCISSGGKRIPYRYKDGNVFFEVKRGQMVEISFK